MVKQITSAQTLPLRHLVLRPHQPVENCIYPLDDVSSAAHFGFFLDDGRLVSIGSISIESRAGGAPHSWRLRGMATHPEMQGKGYGAKVLRACLDHVQAQGGYELWCNARTIAAGFYSRFGFTNLTPEPYELPGIGPHFMLTLVVGETK
jgi:GNAT superfamily N-acetyltransferase